MGSVTRTILRAPPAMLGRMPMLARRLVSQVLEDDALTRGLGDPEARVLVEWLVEHAERIAEELPHESAARNELGRLCRRGRSVSRFVILWCHQGACGAAGQLAAAERFAWPLPPATVDPCELMEAILSWEDRHSHLSILTATGLQRQAT
jgi:hypothetical protein